VAYSWGRKSIRRGDVIVLTEMEHHANLVPWQLLVQEKDGDLEFIPITDDGVLRGDLVVVGGGDPSISERSDTPGVLTILARRIRDGGITRIEGGVIGDDDLFPSAPRTLHIGSEPGGARCTDIRGDNPPGPPARGHAAGRRAAGAGRQRR